VQNLKNCSKKLYIISKTLNVTLLTFTSFYFEKLNIMEKTMASILAVDDSASMRKMVTFTLKSAGYDVEEAVDGVDALEKAQSKQFDCIITDVNMPNKDGITLIKDLRAIANYKFTPMLTLTTESGMEKKMEGKAAGATGWIVKPFDPDQLLKTLKKVLG
jgi:two-component system chemotaxis response regulator CheY